MSSQPDDARCGLPSAALTVALARPSCNAATGSAPGSRVWWEPVPDDVIVMGTRLTADPTSKPYTHPET
jgi:hypothetical protein